MAKKKATAKKPSSARSRAPRDPGRSRPEWVEGYTFDPEAAERPAKFIETFCRKPPEEAFGKAVPLKLIPWQRERFIHPIFGWKRPNGRLRYRRGACFCPKKQGKSYLMAALSSYLGSAHFPIADVYLAAVDRDQAKEIYRVVAKFVDHSPALTKLYEIIDSKGIIRNREHGNVIRCLSADAYKSEGLNGSIIVDEIHAHKNDRLISALMYATRATPNGLVLTISTAGDDRNGIGYQWWKDAELVIANPAANPSFYGLIYAANPDDPRGFGDPEVWREANPSMGIAFPEEEFAADYQDALTSPVKMTRFLKYSLNVWQQSETRWLVGKLGEKFAASMKPRPDLTGLPCVLGLDMASNRDMTAATFLFKLPDGSYYAVVMYWIPVNQVHEREQKDSIPYTTWINEKWLRTTEGDRLNHKQVAKDIIEFAKDHEILDILADQYQVGLLASLLEEEGLEVRSIAQRTSVLNAPSKMFESVILDDSFGFDNPIMLFNGNNVCVYEDITGCIMPDKKKSKEKIDGICSTIFAFAGAIDRDGDLGGPSETTPQLVRLW